MERIRQLAAENVPKARIARDLKVSRMTVYRALKGEGAPTAWIGGCGPGDPEMATLTGFHQS